MSCKHEFWTFRNQPSICVECGKTSREIELESKLAALIEQQAATIEALKCCGNCRWYKNCKKYDSVSGSDKCDSWQVKEG